MKILSVKDLLEDTQLQVIRDFLQLRLFWATFLSVLHQFLGKQSFQLRITYNVRDIQMEGDFPHERLQVSIVSSLMI